MTIKNALAGLGLIALPAKASYSHDTPLAVDDRFIKPIDHSSIQSLSPMIDMMIPILGLGGTLE